MWNGRKKAIVLKGYNNRIKRRKTHKEEERTDRLTRRKSERPQQWRGREIEDEKPGNKANRPTMRPLYRACALGCSDSR